MIWMYGRDPSKVGKVRFARYRDLRISSMKSIRPVLPNVGAAAVLFANATISGWPVAVLIAANIFSNGRDEIRLNRSTSTLTIIPIAFLAGLDECAEYLGPIFLEASVALESAFQHGSYAVLGFGPP